MTWKAYAAVSGAGLLATYLFSSPISVGPERAALPGAATGTRAVPTAVDIQEQALRLQTQLRAVSEFEEPSRNPFRFGGRPVERREPVAREPSVAPEPVVTPPPAPEPPPIRLSGIATSIVDGVRQRSAVLITAGGILTVREGDTVGAEYRVSRIEDDAIELVAADGATRRLALRP